MRTCHACGADVGVEGGVGFRDDCPGCARPLHVCLNCKHRDVGSERCREPMAEAVRDVDRANLCDWFVFVEGERVGDAEGVRAAREAAEKLFE